MGGGTEQPDEINQKYTKDKFVTFRALLAIQIVFGHTFPDNAYGITVLDKILLPFNNTGFLCTALFFFLSGYGVYESAKKRGGYFEHYISKKVITILVPYWIINIAYLAADYATSGAIDLRNLCISSVWPVYNRAAWYVISVFIVYFFMYFTMHLLKLKHTKMYIAMAGLLIVYTVVFYLLKCGSQWFVSTFAVLFGILFSDYKEKILRKSNLLLEVAVFTLLYVGMLWRRDYVPYSGKAIIKIILSLIAPLIVVTIMEKRRVETKWLNYIGAASYEIYLVQGLFVQYLKLPDTQLFMVEVSPLVNVILAVLTGVLVSKPIGMIVSGLQKRMISS